MSEKRRRLRFVICIYGREWEFQKPLMDNISRGTERRPWAPTAWFCMPRQEELSTLLSTQYLGLAVRAPLFK